MTPPGVVVVRGERELHLLRTRVGVVLECVKLYEDFRRSYEGYAKQYVLGNAAAAQSRLGQLTQYDYQKARRIDKLPPERWPLVDKVPSDFIEHATPIRLRYPR